MNYGQGQPFISHSHEILNVATKLTKPRVSEISRIQNCYLTLFSLLNVWIFSNVSSLTGFNLGIAVTKSMRIYYW